MSPKAAQAAGENFGSHPVCAGPFKFVERVAQDRIVVERFADYWDKDKIKLDRIVYLPIPDSTVRLANLQSGGLDMIERVAATDLDAVRKDPRLKLAASHRARLLGDHDQRRQRRALEDAARPGCAGAPGARAVDRPRGAQPGRVQRRVPAGKPMGLADNPYYVKELPIPARDVAKAKALLAAAAAPNPVVDDDGDQQSRRLQAAQVIQAMAKESGFDIQIQATEFASALQLAAKGDFEAFLIGWSGRIDPDGNIYNLRLLQLAVLNDGHYCNAEVDRELDAARKVDTRADRLAHYRNVAEHILQDLPIIYLYHAKWLYATSARLSGFTPYPDGLIRPQGLRLE